METSVKQKFGANFVAKVEKLSTFAAELFVCFYSQTTNQ